MSNFNLTKKLLPAKKAWKSFKATFQSKFQKLKTSRAIKRTRKYCINTLNSIHLIISRRLYYLTRNSNTRSLYHFHYYHQQSHQKQSFSVIYVDELFSGQFSSLAHEPTKVKEMVGSSSNFVDKSEENVEKKHHQIAASSSGVKIFEKKILPSLKVEIGESSTSRTTANGAGKFPLLPQFRGVDERAEEFISKFRLDMKLQREKSILDFQEMLARGA